MSTLTVDPVVVEALGPLAMPTELRDPSGKVLGVFTPSQPSAEEIAQMYARARAHFDPAEIRRRKSEPGKDYTTAEVLAYLHSLDGSESQ